MEKDLTISRIDIFEYFGCNSKLKTALSDYYVKNNDCVIILAVDNLGEQVGLLIYEQKTAVEILYVKTNCYFVAKKLLNYVIDVSDKIVRYRVVNNKGDENLALDCGFTHESSVNIYRSKDRNHPDVVRFLEKYNKLYNALITRHYTVKSFDQLNCDELNQIKCNPDNEFASELNPTKFLENNLSNLSKRVSTAVISNGKVVAYSLIRCVGNKCIFEILCVGKSYQKTYAIVPAIMRPLNELIKEGFTYITFAAYQTNAEVIQIYANHMSDALESVTVQHNMVYLRK